MKTEEKRPDDKLLIVVDYTQRLDASDSIAASTWSLGADLNEEDKGIIGTHYTWILVSGGDALSTYQVANVMTSANAEKKRSVIPLFIKDETAVPLE